MPFLQFPRRCLRYWMSIALTVLGVAVVHFVSSANWLSHHGDFDIMQWRTGGIVSDSSQFNATGCAYLRGMDNILVILKTGATEALEKIPLHIDTTLRCAPHYAIFSDYEEEIAGVRTRDTLGSISEETRHTNPDFGIYNRLRISGRKGLTSEDWTDEENGPYGKPGNPGWKLDKWKFVPMVDEALLVKPDAQWYVFIEADSYVFWRNMVQWLSRLDAKKPLYLGAPMQMGNEVFAYGGAGIVLSNPAMQLVSQFRAGNSTGVERMTADDWAGDHVLGMILKDLGVSLVWSWPLLVPIRVWEFEFFTEGNDHKLWCYPVASYHHMSLQDIQDMWLFEQKWVRFKKDSVLLHRDIFQWHVYDAISSEKDDWDNLSSDNEPEASSTGYPTTFDECARKCSLITDCLQFSFSGRGCSTSTKVVGGGHRLGYSSGWMATRIKALLKNAQKCAKAQYIIAY
ncbi:hypothetical protein BJY01DRAFT_250147 [Aspergillus pseudoustus]|uniref:N-acetylgalactosaminide beta-1,3-galactosyltransferase n=1 Tax=Aspergillus pseudoustus TaxID=1810923 RepID=A0ABR4JJE0_9EURO